MESYRRQGSKKLIWQKIEQKINNISYTFFFQFIYIIMLIYNHKKWKYNFINKNTLGNFKFQVQIQGFYSYIITKQMNRNNYSITTSCIPYNIDTFPYVIFIMVY